MRVEGRAWHRDGVLFHLSVVLLAAACTQQGGPRPTVEAGAPAQLNAALGANAPVSAEAQASADGKPAAALPPASLKTRDQCAAICELSRQLQCKSPGQCLPNCLAMASATPCSEQMTAFYACLVGEPAAHWRCDTESGIAQIREGFCEHEQQQTVSCMEAKMAR